MEVYTRPVRARRLNGQQDLVAEEICKHGKPSKVELTTRRSRSRIALSDLTNREFQSKEKCTRGGVSKQQEKPSLILLESFTGTPLDAVLKESRVRTCGTCESIGKKKQLEKSGDSCDLKRTDIGMETLHRGSAEKNPSHNAEKRQTRSGYQQSIKETPLLISMSVETKPWKASMYDDRGSLKMFGSNLNLSKRITNNSNQSNRSRKRKDLIPDDQVAINESLRRLSYSLDEEKRLGFTVPNQVYLEVNLNNAEQKSNMERTTTKAQNASIRRSTRRVARKEMNYSEDTDGFINYEKANVNSIKPDCHRMGEAAAYEMGIKFSRSSSFLDTERAKDAELHLSNLGKVTHDAFSEMPSDSVGSTDQARGKYLEEIPMRTAPKQVAPSRRIRRLPPKYGQKLNTRCDDVASLELASELTKGTVGGSNPLAKVNVGTEESPASCREGNIASDRTDFGEVNGSKDNSEIMNGTKLEVKCINQKTQRGAKRGKKSSTVNNLEAFDSAINADVLECFPSNIPAENSSRHQENYGETKEGIEAATANGTHITLSTLDDKPVPCKAIASFEDADLPRKVIDCCKQLGKPTLLQAHALPLLLAGQNIFCKSGPSSGQLYIYGINTMVHMLTKKKTFSRSKPSPLCLVLTPFSELVVQITQSFEETFSSLRMKFVSLIDGDLSQAEKSMLKPGKAVLVTTPQTFQKVLQSGRCSLSSISFLVLDRADSMLHCGSDSALRDILNQTPSTIQTAIFASMWLPELEQLLKDAFHKVDALKIDVQDIRDVADPLQNQIVSQTVEVLEENARDVRLTAVVQTYQREQSNRVLVFALYKEEALHIQGLLHQSAWWNARDRSNPCFDLL